MRAQDRRLRASSAILLASLVVWGAAPRAAAANAVSEWSAIAAQAAVVNAARAGTSNIDITYVHIAIYDAVNAIDGGHEVFAVRPRTRAQGASPEAATAAAAYTVLKWLFPTQEAFLNGAYANFLLTIPSGPAKDQGIAVGTEVANAFTALRANDGRNANVPYVFRSGPGEYQQTPGGAPTPVTPWLAQMKTFAIKSSDHFHVPGPPNLESEEWADNYNLTKAFGRSTASSRTPEQTINGQFYAENPGGQLNRNIRGIAEAHGLSLVDSARFFAQVYVTIADAQMTTWHWKYHYNFWRPVTAIRAGDTDDNPETDPDPAWLPLVNTPSHPEYPAAHPTVTGALANAVKEFFGTNHVDVTLTSTSVPGAAMTEIHFTNTDDIVEHVINGRIYGGMHYRISGDHGAKVARKVAHYIATHEFRPVH